MAKQTLNLDRVGGATTSNATPGSGNSLTLIKTGSIAYKIDTENSDWVNMLNPAVASGDPEKKPLIGLQIKFGEDAPVFTQLCFNIKPIENESYFFSGKWSMVLKDNMSHDIIEMPDAVDKNLLYAGLYHTSSATASGNTKLYEKLDGYEPIDFVFFPLDQLQAMTNLYKGLIISGSKISPGRKLSYMPQALTADKIYKKDYFSLKIEGSEPKWNSDEKTKSASAEPGAAMIPGHPCPPDWQLFIAVLGAVYSKVSNPSDVFKPEVLPSIRKSFNNHVVLQSSTNLPAQD